MPRIYLAILLSGSQSIPTLKRTTIASLVQHVTASRRENLLTGTHYHEVELLHYVVANVKFVRKKTISMGVQTS